MSYNYIISVIVYFKFPGLEYLKYRLGAKKATIRLKVGTLRAKWLQEFK